MQRPSRSDEQLAAGEEARIEAEAREYFEEMAPKRHTKPSRSDHSSVYVDAGADASNRPELHKFQDLEAHSQEIVYDGSKPAEEYMETEYYHDLNCIDKHHHTTGSGFIKTEGSDPIATASASDDGSASDRHASSKANPATNDWIPSAQTQSVIPASNKPERSDS